MSNKTAKGNQQQTNANAMVPHSEDPLLTLSEVGRMIGKSHTTIRRWVDDGLLKPVRDPSGMSRIRKSTVDAFYAASALAEVADDKIERQMRAAEVAAERRDRAEPPMSQADLQAWRMQQYEGTPQYGQADIPRDGTA